MTSFQNPRLSNRDTLMSSRIPTLPVAALVAAFTLSACSSDSEGSPTMPVDPVQSIAVAPSLMAALDDARERVLPTVDADIQSALGNALRELQSALDAGQAARSRHAVAAARALLVLHADSADADSADLASVYVLLIAVDEAVRPERSAQ
jgi:hypothetical protein